MSSFRAEIVVRFESENVEAAGRDLRRLAEAAREIGFVVETGRVEEDADRFEGTGRGGTFYGPIEPRDEA